MPRSSAPNADRVYAAVDRWKASCLIEDGSLFTPGAAIWTPSNTEDLHKRFVQSPDASSDTFRDKFERQMQGAPDATLQLAAELLYVHVVIAVPSTIGGDTKRKLVRMPLEWRSSPLGLPSDLDAALDAGILHPGAGFNQHRPYYLWFLIEFARAFKARAPAERRALLDDPWAFKEMVWSVPLQKAQAQREALLHLVHPDAFEDIASGDHKRRMVRRFAEYAGAPTDDLDRALARIRAALATEHGPSFKFYDAAIRVLWEGGGEEPKPPTPVDKATVAPKRAWLVRGANNEGKNHLPLWLEQGWCSIGWAAGGPLASSTTYDGVRDHLRKAWPDQSAGWLGQSTGNVHRFLARMQVGDAVLTVEGPRVYVGIVESAPYWAEPDGTDSSHRRKVRWLGRDKPIPRGTVGARLAKGLASLLTVVDLSGALEDVNALLGSAPPKPKALGFVPPDDALAESLLLPRAFLDEVAVLLRERRQLVFHGPPGTGKTFVARRLAQHLAGAPERVRLVQFHPSTSYEDFFEGFRPVRGEGGGGLQLDLVKGPLRQIAEAAEKDPHNPYVLIIDEINRANLPRVFGELYFLLEYRDEPVYLQYSPDEPFSLPPNLFFIGTMNTADRSIALVDAAIRRRFYFVPFYPDRPPVKGLLRRWLQRKDLSEEPADLLDALNAAIGNPDLALGPSYLMRDNIDEPGILEETWRYSVLPVLAEVFHGVHDFEERYGLARLRGGS